MKKGIFAVIFALFATLPSQGQDVRFTQVFASPLRLNPAIMGSNHHMRFIAGYRSQWGNLGDGFTSSQFTFMTPVMMKEDGGKLDIGLSAINDEAGAFNKLDAALSVNYRLKLSSTGHNLSVALYGGYIQNKLDVNELTFDEQYTSGSFNPSAPNSEGLLQNNTNYVDAGFGVMWHFNPEREGNEQLNAFSGISGYHVNKPNESLTEVNGELPMKLITVSGIKIFTNSDIDFTPVIMVTSQEATQELATGLYTDYHLKEDRNLTLGVWYRQKQSLAFILGVEFSKFAVGYSYDLPGSQLNDAVSGSSTHEISLSYRLDRAAKKDIEYVTSPFSLY